MPVCAKCNQSLDLDHSSYTTCFSCDRSICTACNATCACELIEAGGAEGLTPAMIADFLQQLGSTLSRTTAVSVGG
jgi:hypothetical protein